MRVIVGRIIPVLLVVAAFPAGAAIGDYLRPRSEASSMSGETEGLAGDASSEGEDESQGAGSSSDAGGAHTQEASNSAADADVTIPFPEQFIVPLMRDDGMRGMMVLGLAIEVSGENNDILETRGLRLRDALLRRLLVHANTGGFDGNFTAPPHLDLLREELSRAAEGAIGGMVKDVLITDIAYQGTGR